jgi:hypothetical protein
MGLNEATLLDQADEALEKAGGPEWAGIYTPNLNCSLTFYLGCSQ